MTATIHIQTITQACACCSRSMTPTAGGDRLMCWAGQTLCIRCCSCCPDLIAAENWWTENKRVPAWSSLTLEGRTSAFLVVRAHFLRELDEWLAEDDRYPKCVICRQATPPTKFSGRMLCCDDADLCTTCCYCCPAPAQVRYRVEHDHGTGGAPVSDAQYREAFFDVRRDLRETLIG